MICKNCGKEIADTAKFCPRCGAEQITIQNTQTQAASQNYYSAKAAGVDRPKRAVSRLCGWTVVMTLGLAVLSFFPNLSFEAWGYGRSEGYIMYVYNQVSSFVFISAAIFAFCAIMLLVSIRSWRFKNIKTARNLLFFPIFAQVVGVPCYLATGDAIRSAFNAWLKNPLTFDGFTGGSYSDVPGIYVMVALFIITWVFEFISIGVMTSRVRKEK